MQECEVTNCHHLVSFVPKEQEHAKCLDSPWRTVNKRLLQTSALCLTTEVLLSPSMSRSFSIDAGQSLSFLPCLTHRLDDSLYFGRFSTTYRPRPCLHMILIHLTRLVERLPHVVLSSKQAQACVHEFSHCMRESCISLADSNRSFDVDVQWRAGRGEWWICHSMWSVPRDR